MKEFDSQRCPEAMTGLGDILDVTARPSLGTSLALGDAHLAVWSVRLPANDLILCHIFNLIH